MNILLTSAGRRTYLIDYFKAALHKNGRIYASNSIYTYSLSHADEYILTPQIYDKNYIDFLLNYCKVQNITCIIPLFDIDLPILSQNKALFKEYGINVIVSDLETINICNDKWTTYKFLKQNGIPTPETYLSINDATDAIADNRLSYPLIVKPRWGMGSIGICKACNETELRFYFSKLKRDIFNTYLKFESSQDIDQCVIIQEAIEGEEYGLDILNNLQGQYVTTIAKQKIAMRSGETDIAEIVNPLQFIDIAQKISSALKHIANVDVDCFIDTTGKIYVLEMNCRFGGQYPFSHLAGANFPAQIIEWQTTGLTRQEFIQAKIGVKSCKDLHPVVME